MPRQNRIKVFYNINYFYDAFSIDLMQNTLSEELRIESQNSCKSFLQIIEDNFLDILCYIENDIKKQDTKFRQALPQKIKLASNIRLLAAGALCMDMEYQFWHNTRGF